jgi:hypothetical protein
MSANGAVDAAPLASEGRDTVMMEIPSFQRAELALFEFVVGG